VACCTQLALFKVQKIPTLPPCVEDVLFVNKPGGHLLWGLPLSLQVATSPKLWAVFCPPFICAPANSLVQSSVGFSSAREISEALKVTHSNLTCQYSCPIPVRGSAGDKWGFKGQRICYCYCDQVDLPILLSISSAVVLVISEALKGHANQSHFPCQLQDCVPPHYVKWCVASFVYICMGYNNNGQ